MDVSVGKVLSVLDATGQSKNAQVVYTSDHGYNIGERGLLGEIKNV